MSKDILIKNASARQDIAAHVASSVWVSANAGTGKTRVLTKRVLRLLLNDHDLKPSQILAVTFTRAAAREMAVRIREEIQAWQYMDDQALTDFLVKYLDRAVSDADITRARSLFVTILDDAVNTNTIHGLCQQLLGKFPIEAGLSPGFNLVDDKESQRLLKEAQGQVFLQAYKGEFKHMWAFELLSKKLAESTLADVLNSFVLSEQRYRKLFRHHGGAEALVSALASEFGIDAEPELYRKKLHDIYIKPHEARFKEMALAMYRAGGNPAKSAPLAEACDPQLFLTSTGSVRKTSSVITKKIEQFIPVYEEIKLDALMYLDKIANFDCYLLTSAYIYLGSAVADAYKNLKGSDVDFDDLIVKAADVLKNSDWVRYKMDTRIAHVLLDEAQDTDNDQWFIVKAIVDEFYAGEGQNEKVRTFFAVGDIKQSIYRFRGAQPHVFAEMREYLKQQEAVGHKIAIAELIASFRSTEPILNFVDKVFADEKRQKAVDAVASELRHQAIQIGSGGVVELWPMTPKNERRDKPEPWALPTERIQKPDAHRDLAAQVATHIHGLLQSNQVLETTGKHICPQDVMILLRSRKMMPLLVAELDKLAIPHSGADQVNLEQDLVVQDILALIKYVTNPQDLLSLVQVLRSPMVGMDSAQVQSLAPFFNLPAELAGTFRGFIEESKRLSPYALVTKMLVELDVRGMYNRMRGGSVDDVIDIVLDSLMQWQRGGNGSLIGFVDYFEKEQDVIKREIDTDQGVQILTSHGSKGLEAPIVYLPDATANYLKGLTKETVLWDVQTDEQDVMCLYRMPKAQATSHQKKLEEAEQERIFKDEMRLLYVALTRSKERLYIGGVDAGDSAESWYKHIADAVEDWDEDDDGVKRFVKTTPLTAKQNEVSLETVEEELPSWVEQIAPAESLEHVVQGSEAGGVESPFAFTKEADKKLFERGRVIHKLLEVLPAVADKETKARNFLAHYEFSDAEREGLIGATLDVFTRYPQFFGENSRAEVEISTLIGKTRLEGKMDRLIVEDDVVTVLDYKTNKQVPSDIPQHYAKQLQHYMKALKEVFPTKHVRGGIIWTSASPVRLDWLGE